jgi:outer membrane protein insertion porin family
MIYSKIKYFFSIIIILIPLNSFSKNINFQGLNKLSIDDLQTLTDINLSKDSYNKIEINNLINDLYLSDLIFNIELIEESDSYYINIEEFYIIQNIYINGNINLKNEIFLDNISSKTETVFSKKSIEKDLSLIRNIYSTKGFNDILVLASTEKISNDRINLIFTINESLPSKIKRILINGNNFFSDNYILTLINSKNQSSFNIFSTGSNLNQDIFNFDKNIIKSEYEKFGFYDAEVQYDINSINKSNLYLTFYIKEGNRVSIKDITYEFPKNLEIDKLKKLSSIFKKKFTNFDINKINKHLDELNEVLTSNNIIHLAFEANLEEQNGVANLKFFTRKFNPININKIEIIGNSITKDKTIRSKLPFESGDIIHPSKIQEAEKKISRLDYIISSNISVTENDNNSKDILIDLIENKKTGNFGFAGSFSGDTGFGIGLILEDKNILGTGNKIDSSFDFNAEKTLFDIEYTSFPQSNDNISNIYSLFNQELDLTDSFGFKSQQTGFGYSQNFKYSPSTNMIWGIDYNNTRNHSAVNSSTSVTDNINNFSSLGIKFSIIHDTANDIFYPTNGFNNTLNFYLSNADKTSNSYYRFNGNNENYFELSNNNNFIFIINNFGVSESLKDNLKTVNAFSLGGMNFKGFDYRGLGPYDSNIYLGGNKFFTSTFGYGGSFLFDGTDDFKFKLFSSIGSIWGSDYHNNSNKIDIRSSVGISFDIMTPFAPLSMSYAIPIKKNSSDKVKQFNFILGTSF